MSTVSIPYSFAASTDAVASQVNANFTALAAIINGNIDNTNIGPAGLFASQVVPTTTGQATFGGTVAYAFPAAVGLSSNKVITWNGITGIFGDGVNNLSLRVPSAAGSIFVQKHDGSANVVQIQEGGAGFTMPLSTAADSVHSGFVAPFYTNAGAATMSTLRCVSGSATFSASSTTTVTLSNAGLISSVVAILVTQLGGTFAGAVTYLASFSTPTLTITASTTNSNTVSFLVIGT